MFIKKNENASLTIESVAQLKWFENAQQKRDSAIMTQSLNMCYICLSFPIL